MKSSQRQKSAFFSRARADEFFRRIFGDDDPGCAVDDHARMYRDCAERCADLAQQVAFAEDARNKAQQMCAKEKYARITAENKCKRMAHVISRYAYAAELIGSALGGSLGAHATLEPADMASGMLAPPKLAVVHPVPHAAGELRLSTNGLRSLNLGQVRALRDVAVERAESLTPTPTPAP